MGIDWSSTDLSPGTEMAKLMADVAEQETEFFGRAEWRRCAELGLTGLSVPTADGGAGLGFAATARVTEAFGRYCPDMGLAFGVLAHLFACAMPITEHGSARLRAELLPGLCSGALIGANAITEEQAGSDVSALAARAVPAPDGYRLSGAKTFVSNAPVADVFLVYAVTRPEFGHLGLSAFAVDAASPGLTVSAPLPKAGLTRCPAGQVVMDDCFVPASRMLGRGGQGAAIFQASMRWERTCLFAAYLGQSARLLERCVSHARSRRQFGTPIGANQAVAHPIARMWMRLESARTLLKRACERLDRGERAVAEVAMAKLAVSENAVRTAHEAVRLFGAAGILVSGGVERELRDALPCTTFSGTSEMQLEQIAKELGL
jgi:alkylation response protein AidB-like acyl-CoA dehydrogenase